MQTPKGAVDEKRTRHAKGILGQAFADCFVIDCAPACPVIYNVRAGPKFPSCTQFVCTKQPPIGCSQCLSCRYQSAVIYLWISVLNWWWCRVLFRCSFCSCPRVARCYHSSSIAFLPGGVALKGWQLWSLGLLFFFTAPL